MVNAVTRTQDPVDPENTGRERFVLYIDVVGAFLLCPQPRVTIGGPALEGEAADVALVANLSRRHATVKRSGECYILEAHAPAQVSGRPVYDRAALADGCEIVLGETVRLRFRLPTVLSATAVLDFVSDHRPPRSVDGVILMDETCLLGPGTEHHVRCPRWDGSVVLYRREGEFFVRSPRGLLHQGEFAEETRLVPGETVRGTDSCFRLERLDETA